MLLTYKEKDKKNSEEKTIKDFRLKSVDELIRHIENKYKLKPQKEVPKKEKKPKVVVEPTSFFERIKNDGKEIINDFDKLLSEKYLDI